MLAVNAAFALLVIVAVRPVVSGLLGPEWLSVVPAARILAVAMVFRAAMTLANQLFYAVERPRAVFAVNAARVAVLALTVYPLLRHWGTQGVAVSVLLSCVAGALLSVVLTRATLSPRA